LSFGSIFKRTLDLAYKFINLMTSGYAYYVRVYQGKQMWLAHVLYLHRKWYWFGKLKFLDTKYSMKSPGIELETRQWEASIHLAVLQPLSPTKKCRSWNQQYCSWA
jgi:hypothetical protein